MDSGAPQKSGLFREARGAVFVCRRRSPELILVGRRRLLGWFSLVWLLLLEERFRLLIDERSKVGRRAPLDLSLRREVPVLMVQVGGQNDGHECAQNYDDDEGAIKMDAPSS